VGTRVIATVDRRALRHNLAVARARAPQSRVLAVIKANAYGHGLVACAEALYEADVFGVTDIDEAEQLRHAGCRQDILIMQGLIEEPDARRVLDGGFQLVIHRREQLGWLEQAVGRQRPRAPLTLWLKLETGMGRLGLATSELSDLFARLRRQPWVADLVLMTHLASATMPAAALNDRQLLQFARACQPLAEQAPQTSIAASASLLALDCSGDIVRPGLLLYGISPFAWSDLSRRPTHFDLRPAMTLEARLISVRQQQAGDSIGYNSRFVCPAPMTVGIVSAGYADGYPVTAPNGCPVLVGGRRSRTLGRVSMDMLAIDLTDLPANLGDLVTLWGPQLPLEEVADHCGLIPYALLTALGPRVRREYR
jgi:alanine racemase